SLRTVESTGVTGLNQVLVLIVVDIEVLEGGSLSALIGTEGVILQVNNDAHDGWVLVEVLDLNDLRHAECGCELGVGAVDSTTVLVLQQEHVSHEPNRGEQGRVAGSAV